MHNIIWAGHSISYKITCANTRTVWSETFLWVLWIAKASNHLRVAREDSDQSAHPRRLIRVFAVYSPKTDSTYYAHREFVYLNCTNTHTRTHAGVNFACPDYESHLHGLSWVLFNVCSLRMGCTNYARREQAPCVCGLGFCYSYILRGFFIPEKKTT